MPSPLTPLKTIAAAVVCASLFACGSTAHAQYDGPCTRTPFSSAIPPSLIPFAIEPVYVRPCG